MALRALLSREEVVGVIRDRRGMLVGTQAHNPICLLGVDLSILGHHSNCDFGSIFSTAFLNSFGNPLNSVNLNSSVASESTTSNSLEYTDLERKSSCRKVLS